MVGVDIGGDLEDEASKLAFLWLYQSLLGLSGLGRRCYLDEAVEKFLHTEVVERRTEEHRCHLGRTVSLHIEGWINAVDQLQILTQLGSLALTHMLIERFGVDVHFHLLGHALLVGSKEVELLLVDIVHALEPGTLSDRSAQGSNLNLEFFLQFVEHVEGIAALTVHLVDEDDNRRIAHTAHFHQLAGLGLHTLG